jgi:CDP-paratose 2-epimerase
MALKRENPAADVTAFDNLRRRGSELNLARLSAAGVRFVHGDVRSRADVLGFSPAPDLIVECSAEPSVLAGYGGSPEYLVETNLNGCFNELELARRSGADFIFISTSRVYPYGPINGLAFTEEATRYSLAAEQTIPGASALGIAESFPLEGARSLYGMTKLASELMIAEYGDAYGISYIIDRCGLIAGPWQMAKADQGVVTQWVAAHVFGCPLRYIGFGGSGKQVRDFLHVDDFTALIVRQAARMDLYRNRIFNVGGGMAHSLSLLELTALCREVTGRPVPVTASEESRPADIRIYVSDSRNVMAVDGWRPRHDARATIESIYSWLSAEGERLRPVLLGES